MDDPLADAGGSGVEFAPHSIRSRRGRDPAAIVAIVLVAVVALAIAKPWDDQGRPRGEAARSAASSGPTESGASSPVRGLPSPAPVAVSRVPPEPPAAAELGFVLGAARTHDGWGVRVIADAPPSSLDLRPPLLEERWFAARPGGPPATIPIGESAVRAFGLTVPAGTAPLDVRVWRFNSLGPPTWLETVPVDGRAPGAPPLLWPPFEGGAWDLTWPSGRYQFELLTAAGIVSVDALIQGASNPDDPRGAPPPAAPFSAPDGSETPGASSTNPPFGLDVNGVDSGAFVASQPVATSGSSERPSTLPAISVAGGQPTSVFDDRAAWLDAHPTSIDQGAQGSALDPLWLTSYQPGAVALGVIAPEGLEITGARVVRLEPAGIGNQVISPSFVDVHATFRDEAPRSIVQFASPVGTAWPAGVYGLIVDLEAGGIVRHALYVVTLLPGPESQTPALVAAARAWAPHGGSFGLVAGKADTAGWGPTAALAPAAAGVRSVAAIPIPPNGRPVSAIDPVQTCGSGATIDVADPIIGVAHPTGLLPVNAGLSRVFTSGSISLRRPALAPAVTPGLTLVAPGDGQSWEPGVYRLTLVSEDDISTFVVCVGQPQDGVLTVPTGSASPAAFDDFRRRLAGE
ncbi:MAG TPA: hypothetical protein VIM30_08675 [Candidatus Limnocylindrales bacterium]